MAGIVKPLKILSANCLWPGFSGTKTKVRQGKAKSWASRRKTLAARIKASGAVLVGLQEIGQVEAAELFALLGEDWNYQRSGLNVVGWRKDLFEFVKVVEFDLPHTQWPGRTYLEVWLRDADGNRLRVASTHFGVKYLGVAFSAVDSSRQQAQFQKIASSVNDEDDDWPLVICVDTNNKQSGSPAKGLWAVAKKYGYAWDRSGVDALLWNFGARLAGIGRLDLADASDHDGRVATLTTTKK